MYGPRDVVFNTSPLCASTTRTRTSATNSALGARKAQRQRPLALRLLQRLRFVETDAARHVRNVPLLLDLRHAAAVGVARAGVISGCAARHFACLLRERATCQTERERCAYSGGYGPSMIALGLHRFAPFKVLIVRSSAVNPNSLKLQYTCQVLDHTGRTAAPHRAASCGAFGHGFWTGEKKPVLLQ